MRPHHLEFTAIGSYAGTVNIDFDALSPFGLFHIHGPTGAGKSSLLDAMCFALYGSVPGARRADGLRSHHAEPATEAVACLEFSAQNADWRIVRSPTQMRGKLRGTGTTEQRATATLHRRDSMQWSPVASGPKEVDPIVHNIIGLDASQFMQVIVLPQGGFQKALQAGADERAALLSTLFHTERFETYSSRLKERADNIGRNVALQGTKARGIATQAATRSRSLRLSIDWPENAVLEDSEKQRMNQAARLAAKSASGYKVLVDKAKAHRDKEDAVLKAASIDAERHKRRDDALRRIAEFNNTSERFAALRQELKEADDVAPVVPLLERFTLADTAAALAKASLEGRVRSSEAVAKMLPDTMAPLRDAIIDLSSGDLDGQAIEKAQRTGRDLVGSAQALVERGGTAAVHRRSAREHATSASAAASAAAKAAGDLEQINSALDELQARQANAGAALNRHGYLQSTVARLRSQVEAGTELAKLKPECEARLKQLQAADEESLNARRRHLDLLEARLDGIAGELAERLANGEACSVCGSVDHPRPAPPTNNPVTAEQVSAAHRRAETARAAADGRRAEVETRRQELQGLAIAAGPAVADLQAAAGELTAAEAELAIASGAQAALDIIATESAALHASADASTEAINANNTALVREQTAATVAIEQASQIEADIEAALGASVKPTDVKALLDELLDKLSDSRAALSDFTNACLHKANEHRALDKALAELGIDDVNQLHHRARSADEREHMHDLLADHRETRVAAEATLVELADIADSPAPSLEPLQASVEHASSQLGEAIATHARCESEAAELAKLAGSYAKEFATLRPLQEEAERVRQLADMCRGVGSNDKRMSLERYVLAAYLEEVAVAAGARLQEMTAGRYSLRHSDARVRSNAASGLALLVADTHTGVEREVSTLSGGETFLASLALALGLADVVQQHSGGVHIDALFIDEGFGSLDPDTLDLAMAELDRLREGGRLVGVISHVPALQERIAVGVEVIPGPSGSTIAMSGLAAEAIA